MQRRIELQRKILEHLAVLEKVLVPEGTTMDQWPDKRAVPPEGLTIGDWLMISDALADKEPPK